MKYLLNSRFWLPWGVGAGWSLVFTIEALISGSRLFTYFALMCCFVWIGMHEVRSKQ